MDRCDTESLWFLFASCGRPFMYVDPRSSEAIKFLRAERRRVVGSELELRDGNYAAATIDEMVDSWGRKPKLTIASDGSFIHVRPHDALEDVS